MRGSREGLHRSVFGDGTDGLGINLCVIEEESTERMNWDWIPTTTNLV